MSKIAEAPPWAATDIDPDVFVGELRRRFPGVCAWFGEFTGRWWAITRDRDRLVEAGSPAALGRRLAELTAPRRTTSTPIGQAVPEWTPAPVTPATTKRPTRPSRAAAPVTRPSRRSAHAHRAQRSRGGWRRLLGAFLVRETVR
ncbi:hypothetical protein GCM10010411_94240 [Actinomadura fulvescens]|uniref:Uncharacterized protein n=1 Tax=Actinomadura fulvescens TaxID=46160 RepID=A0ABP6DE63_9ACTN